MRLEFSHFILVSVLLFVCNGRQMRVQDHINQQLCDVPRCRIMDSSNIPSIICDRSSENCGECLTFDRDIERPVCFQKQSGSCSVFLSDYINCGSPEITIAPVSSPPATNPPTTSSPATIPPVTNSPATTPTPNLPITESPLEAPTPQTLQPSIDSSTSTPETPVPTLNAPTAKPDSFMLHPSSFEHFVFYGIIVIVILAFIVLILWIRSLMKLPPRAQEAALNRFRVASPSVTDGYLERRESTFIDDDIYPSESGDRSTNSIVDDSRYTKYSIPEGVEHL